jgi:hypothetical protein
VPQATQPLADRFFGCVSLVLGHDQQSLSALKDAVNPPPSLTTK